MTTKNKDLNFKMLSIRFLDPKAYHYVMATIKDFANTFLKNGEKINLSEALTKIITEWDNAKKR
ncbi:hypothetical protein LCGC14_2063200 [marine sediment metagenome]|uniref:Uncharacterized protein n=1 Tax=marine sediment metagenome TaxID=412755 RepID=A0A0F9EKF3_9ZZZZ